MQRKIRVLVGKPGLDGHDRGAKVVAAALRDAGMEVIYTGLHQTPEQVVEAALQEDVDVVALSILSGAHMTLFPEVLNLMRERGLEDRLLTGGGIVPAEDMQTLAGKGVGRLFGPGSSTQEIIEYVREWFASKHGADALTPLPAPRPVQPPSIAGSEPVSSRVAARKPARTAAVATPRRARAASSARARTQPKRAASRPARPSGRARVAAAGGRATTRTRTKARSRKAARRR